MEFSVAIVGWKKGPKVGMLPFKVGTASSRMLTRDYNAMDLTIQRDNKLYERLLNISRNLKL